MALILNIETSSAVCSVCLSNNGSVIDFREDRSKNSHARVLTLLIDELLGAHATPLSALDAIAVSAGPGSYTGLRIGISAAKGYCYALNKPLLAVPTLLSLAMDIQQKAGNGYYYMPVIDARRMDVYTALYQPTREDVLPAGPYTLNADLEEKLKEFGPVAIGGDAIEKCKTVFTTAPVLYIQGVECHARLLAPLAHEMFAQKQFADVAYFEPMYLKEFYSPKPAGN